MTFPSMIVTPLPNYTPLVGAALWEMEDTRARTLAALVGFDPALIEKVPAGSENSIGSLLYHIALIEADWLYADILLSDYPDWMVDEFPDEDRDEAGHLIQAAGSLDDHLARLVKVRHHLLTELHRLSDQDFTQTQTSGSGILTPQWVLHHLRQHEAEHRGQIQTIRTLIGPP